VQGGMADLRVSELRQHLAKVGAGQ
jgi:hypothetical protein